MANQSQLEQGRAAYAYQCAEEAKKSLGKKGKEYKSYVKKMPMLIKTNGLGATVAFALSKGSKDGRVNSKEGWGLIYNQLTTYLLEVSPNKLFDFKKDELAKTLTTINSFEYRATTIDILAFLSWLRRFADGLIEGEGGTE